jgi:hypothetical protein
LSTVVPKSAGSMAGAYGPVTGAAAAGRAAASGMPVPVALRLGDGVVAGVPPLHAVVAVRTAVAMPIRTQDLLPLIATSSGHAQRAVEALNLR